MSHESGRYLNYLDRNFKGPLDCTLKNLIDSSKPHQARSHSASQAPFVNKNRNVSNVKAYCLAKVTKTLDTKSELAKVERKNMMQQTAASVVKQRYEEAKKQEYLPTTEMTRQYEH